MSTPEPKLTPIAPPSISYMFSLEGDKPKAASKPDEVSKEANTLIQSLSKTASAEVVVKLRQVTELIGEEKTNELCIFVKSMRKLVRAKINPKSLIPPKKRYTEYEYGGFFTADLFDAIKEAQSSQAERKPIFSGEPDPEILKIAKKQHGS